MQSIFVFENFKSSAECPFIILTPKAFAWFAVVYKKGPPWTETTAEEGGDGGELQTRVYTLPPASTPVGRCYRTALHSRHK